MAPTRRLSSSLMSYYDTQFKQKYYDGYHPSGYFDTYYKLTYYDGYSSLGYYDFNYKVTYSDA